MRRSTNCEIVTKHKNSALLRYSGAPVFVCLWLIARGNVFAPKYAIPERVQEEIGKTRKVICERYFIAVRCNK